MADIVTKLWGFCHTLRHDGIDYGDYIEQLTYLLFLKMIEEKLGHSYIDDFNPENGRLRVQNGYFWNLYRGISAG